MKLLISLLLLFCLLTPFSSAETIIYDNVTASNLKFFIIEDDTNLKFLNEYKYEILVDGYSIGEYSKGEKIFYPNNSNVSIITPKSNINTDVSTIWDVGKTNFFIAVMYLGGFLIMIIFIYVLVKRRR